MSSSAGTQNGWRTTTLGALGKYVNGRAFKSTEWAITGRPIIRIQDLTGSNSNPNYFDGDVEERHVVRPGDLLISWSGSLGAYLWDGPEAVLNQHIFKVESSINKRFHYHLARATIADLMRSSHGSGMVHVTKRVFEETPVAIPDDPLLQQRLASFIDGLEAAQRSALAHLASARRTLQQFRQSVLTAACSGSLTADWRLGEGLETAPMSSPDNALGEPGALSELPKSWVWVTPDDLRAPDRAITYGVIKLGSAVPDGVPTLRSSDVRMLRIDESRVKSIASKIADNYSRTYLQGGEVLVTVRGSLGGVAVAQDHMRGWNISREVAMIPLASAALAEYVALAIASPLSQRWMNSATKGVTYTGINIRDLKKLPLPIPSLVEQREILQRVEALFGQADSVGKRIDAASRATQSCAHAALAKAFRADA